jgi:transcriptional regulator with XRE-family HTH domain
VRNALPRLLADRGWTDAELATRAGLDRAHVNQVKNGRALPTVATALRLAQALGVPVAVAFPPGSSSERRKPPRTSASASSDEIRATTTFPAESGARVPRRAKPARQP